MMLPERLQRALARLNGALDNLEAAAARRAQADAARLNLEDELAVMADDRARLAQDLDGALARGHSLARANGEVAGRLARIGETVRGVLDGIAEPRARPEPPARPEPSELA